MQQKTNKVTHTGPTQSLTLDALTMKQWKTDGHNSIGGKSTPNLPTVKWGILLN